MEKPSLNAWKDALYYLHENSGASDEFVSGVFIGLISGLMSCGIGFETCLACICTHIKTHKERDKLRDITPLLPECWRDQYTFIKGKT
jgi:hypothetical protein